MFAEGQDFDCSSTGVSFLCAARQSVGESAYVVLQRTLRAVLDQLAASQPLPPAVRDLPVDGRITATTALAVQTVMAALASRLIPPPLLQPLLSKTADPSAVIRGVATYAVELVRYIEAAVQLPAPAVKYQPSPVLKTIGLSAMGLLALGGVVAIAHSVGARSSGKMDRTRMLPAPTPEELAFEEGDDGGENTGEDTGEDAVIDATTSSGALLPGIV